MKTHLAILFAGFVAALPAASDAKLTSDIPTAPMSIARERGSEGLSPAPSSDDATLDCLGAPPRCSLGIEPQPEAPAVDDPADDTLGSDTIGSAPRWSDSQLRIGAAIHQAATDVDVEPDLSVGVAHAESSLRRGVRSSDGLSRGTFQVRGGTAAMLRRKIRSDALARPPGSDEIALGVAYLRYLSEVFAQETRLTADLTTIRVGDEDERRRFVVAAFNAGEGRVARAQRAAADAGADPAAYSGIRPYLPKITQEYVERVIDHARAWRQLASSTPSETVGS